MPDGSALLDPDQMPQGLSWCADDQPGLSRVRRGKGFSYHRPGGERVTDPRTLARIRALAIPPAWTDVWICPRATGHIQATGRDLKGRKQYRYHTGWSEGRSEAKFHRLTDFARALPRLRRRVEEDLSRRGASRDKAVATTVRLLEITLIRVGNREYARQNRSFGLTTLHKRHLEVDGAALVFAFRGKSGVEHTVTVRDRRLARLLKALRELPGQHLFKYRDAHGDLVPVSSDDVNAYIRDVMGSHFSAKDFRTWAATVSAARALRECGPPGSKAESRRQCNQCLKAVAGLLGNTPAVCRSSYVHPAVFDLHESGGLADLPGPDAKAFEPSLIRALDARPARTA
ncbi:MAG: DNA topoisomerase IB [Brevundimonas sp.]